MLLRRGAPLEDQNMYGGTVLGCAVWSAIYEPKEDHVTIIEELLDAGADVKASGCPTGIAIIDALLRKYIAESA